MKLVLMNADGSLIPDDMLLKTLTYLLETQPNTISVGNSATLLGIRCLDSGNDVLQIGESDRCKILKSIPAADRVILVSDNVYYRVCTLIPSTGKILYGRWLRDKKVVESHCDREPYRIPDCTLNISSLGGCDRFSKLAEYNRLSKQLTEDISDELRQNITKQLNTISYDMCILENNGGKIVVDDAYLNVDNA
jgi:hypothetical protein